MAWYVLTDCTWLKSHSACHRSTACAFCGLAKSLFVLCCPTRIHLPLCLHFSRLWWVYTTMFTPAVVFVYYSMWHVVSVNNKGIVISSDHGFSDSLESWGKNVGKKCASAHTKTLESRLSSAATVCLGPARAKTVFAYGKIDSGWAIKSRESGLVRAGWRGGGGGRRFHRGVGEGRGGAEGCGCVCGGGERMARPKSILRYCLIEQMLQIATLWF